MPKVEITLNTPDPLGYEGNALERVRSMAADELAGIGNAAVDEETAVLRARLGRPTDKLPSGETRYPSHSWGAFAENPSLEVGITGKPCAELVRSAWFESGGTDTTFFETFPQFAGYFENEARGEQAGRSDGDEGKPAMLVFGPEAIAQQTPDLLRAAEDSPVVITDGERPTFVLMSMREYDRLRGRRRLVGSSAELPDHVADEIEGLGVPKP
jgi:prevent-host-death family protein